MAGPNRISISSVIARLREEPYRYSLFQVMWMFDCQDLDRPLLGKASQVRDETVRFGQEAALRFAPAELERYEEATAHHPPRILVNSIGLFGPHGPLPMHMTQYVRDRIHNQGDHTLSAFLDLFHHRIITLFYRAWALNHHAVSYSRPENDRFSRHIGSLFGLGMESFTHRDLVQDEAKLYYAGLLMCPTRHASGLRAILAGYFKLPTQLEPFVASWIEIPQPSQCRLGESPETGALGVSTVVGSLFRTIDQKFRICFGPLKIHEYLRMLPSGDSFKRLRDWVIPYTNHTLVWDVEFTLEDTEIPPVQLGSVGCLGWSTWLISKPKHEAVVVVLGAS